MVKVRMHKQPNGWRAYVKDGRGIVVIDDFFIDEANE